MTRAASRVRDAWEQTESNRAITYLEDVAHELKSRGIVVSSMEVSTGLPADGRIVITGRDASGELWPARHLTLVWHDGAGWWTEWPAEGASRTSHRFLDEPNVAPANVACLVCDMMI